MKARSGAEARGAARLARAAAAAALSWLLASWLVSAAGPALRQPVYVGARACATCHEGPGMGGQHSKWLLTAHARAYADLALPSARLMADLSGVPAEPQQSPVCLGCHATASEAEDWERDPGFFTGDGVQCEMCHGPGSEYMSEAVMRDPEEARRQGLRMLTREDCARCHYVKMSHTKVHGKPRLDIDEAWARIAHPTPEAARPGSPPALPPADAGTDTPAYAGVAACFDCHHGPSVGYAFGIWRRSRHALAYALLAGDQAREMAAAAGVEGDPQQSPACLRCHATGGDDGEAQALPGFSMGEGVGCEACHGPAGAHIAGQAAGGAAGATGDMPRISEASCRRCHEAAHGRPFDAAAAMRAIAHPARAVERAVGPVYKTPVNLALTPGGREIWVACEGSASVIVVDVESRSKVAEIAVGGQPHDVAFDPNGGRAYVSNRLDDTVSVIDVPSRQVLSTVPVGDEPHGLLTGADGRLLYVLNTAQESVSVLDTGTLQEVRRLAASRNPWSLALSPDGSRLAVTNNLARFVPFRTTPVSEVTVIDTESGAVIDRAEVESSNLLQGISWSPDGELALFTLNRTKNLVPMTRVSQGWTITNGLGVLWRDGRVDQVLLDEPGRYFPDINDVQISPDGRLAVATSAGSDRIAIIDVEALAKLLGAAADEARRRIIPNHLGQSFAFVTAHVETGRNPRGVVIAADGLTAFTADALDDTLTVIDLASARAVAAIDLGGPREISVERRGQRLFHSADIAFQRQFSCSSCHPDGHVDGITYDIEPDGIGLNPVDNRTLRGILDTDPFKWTGKNLTLERQCGPRLAVFFTRIDPFTPDELQALSRYISTIPRPPNRHRPLGADLTPAQRRGKKMFEREVTSDGRPIPREKRCVTCHFPPLFTERSIRDVGLQMQYDTHGNFDVPHLLNIYDSAPYLHNGISPTLEEIWTRYNPDDRHGVTNDMTKDQLNDLIEYLKTL